MTFLRRFILPLTLGLIALPALAFDRIDVTVRPRRPEPGDTVVIRIKAPASGGEVRAALLRPSKGQAPLVLKPAPAGPGERSFEASLAVGAGDPEGLYAVHAWTGDENAPRAVGKGWFLRGRILLDYPILSLVDPKSPEADIRAYLDDIHGLGLNFLIVHVLMDPKKAYYPSKIARTDVKPGTPADLRRDLPPPRRPPGLSLSSFRLLGHDPRDGLLDGAGRGPGPHRRALGTLRPSPVAHRVLLLPGRQRHVSCPLPPRLLRPRQDAPPEPPRVVRAVCRRSAARRLHGRARLARLHHLPGPDHGLVPARQRQALPPAAGPGPLRRRHRRQVAPGQDRHHSHGAFRLPREPRLQGPQYDDLREYPRPDPERGHGGRVGRPQLLHLSRQYPQPRSQARKREGHRPGPRGRRRRARGLQPHLGKGRPRAQSRGFLLSVGGLGRRALRQLLRAGLRRLPAARRRGRLRALLPDPQRVALSVLSLSPERGRRGPPPREEDRRRPARRLRLPGDGQPLHPGAPRARRRGPGLRPAAPHGQHLRQGQAARRLGRREGPPEGRRREEAGGEPDEGRDPDRARRGSGLGRLEAGGKDKGRRGVRGRLGGRVHEPRREGRRRLVRDGRLDRGPGHPRRRPRRPRFRPGRDRREARGRRHRGDGGGRSRLMRRSRRRPRRGRQSRDGGDRRCDRAALAGGGTRSEEPARGRIL